MFIRILWCLSVIVPFTAALAQDVPPVPVHTPPCDCCAAKPHYNTKAWAPFTGTVAVITQQKPLPGPLQDQVVVIWDLHTKLGVPLNTWWSPGSAPPTKYYSDPLWNTTNLGDVFGAAIDGGGNIYVAATRVYGSANVGSLAQPGTLAQQAGQIYKIPFGSGAPGAFQQLPNDGNGLGNLYYACEFNSLYATNFYDGLIYRMNAAGVIQAIKWDHGLNLPSAVDAAGNTLGLPAIVGFDGTSTFTALGRRVWAVTVYKNRVWYSTWGMNGNRPTGIRNEIWSVALDANGDPVAPARREITLPLFGANYSNPVSDMRFGPMGTLLLAERSMISNNTPYAHEARLLEYSFNGFTWILTNPTAYKIGTWNVLTNSAGGVDVDASPGGRTWGSGDALHYFGGDYIYGIQGFPPGGGDVTTSILIDDDDDITQPHKRYLGVVRISCPECTNPPAHR